MSRWDIARRVALVPLLATLSVGCNGPERVGQEALPQGIEPLHVLTRITAVGGFLPSGATVTAECEILLVDGLQGTIVRVLSSGSLDSKVGKVPGNRLDGRLGWTGTGPPTVWSNSPPLLGLIDQDLSVDTIALAELAHDLQSAGPAARVGTRYVSVLMGDVSHQVRSTRPLRAVPIAVAVDSLTGHAESIGSVPFRSGELLPWLYRHASVGAIGDTAIIVSFTEGTVAGWVAPYTAPVWFTALPRYFVPPLPVEQVLVYPWIDEGGEAVSLDYLPQVNSGVVLSDGSLLLVRHAGAVRQASQSRSSKLGRWIPTLRLLELHTARGQLTKRLDLPTEAPIRWLGSGYDGLATIGFDHEVQIVAPLGPSTRCGAWPSQITLP